MIVNELMSRNPVTVGLDDRLSKVKAVFDAHRFHHLLVIDDGELIGVISDRDLLKAISPQVGTQRVMAQDLASLDKPAHLIVSRKPITLMAGAPVEEAVAIFNSQRISCIPIVDANGAAIGIITWRDIMRNLTRLCDQEAKRQIAALPMPDGPASAAN